MVDGPDTANPAICVAQAKVDDLLAGRRRRSKQLSGQVGIKDLRGAQDAQQQRMLPLEPLQTLVCALL